MMTPEVEHPKPSVDGYELPCGYLDGEGNLHTFAVVNEMTGEEEEILGSRNMPVTKKINKILGRLVESIGDINGMNVERVIPDLTQGDRVFLLLAIRRATLGDEMPFETKCPSCEASNRLTVDLSELETKKMPDPRVRTYDVTLPKSQKKVRMKVLVGRGEDAISKASSRGKDLITTAIFCRVEAIDDQPPTMKDLKKLSLADRNFLRNAWEDHEGGVETDIEVECPACYHDYTTELDISQQGFFNPSAALRSWKKKSSS